MRLIGTRYATFHADEWLVKCQDLHVADRLPVVCFREWLGYRLGTRLGVAIPSTTLEVHAHHGRLVTQTWLAGCAPPTPERVAALRFESTGIRILLLDLLIANPDRRPENLLERDGLVFPIDFNIAFTFAADPPRAEAAELTIMRWFGTDGVLALPVDGLARLIDEVKRFEHLLSEPYIHFAIEQIPEEFIQADERERLRAGLLLRRASIGTWIRDWWNRTVEPIHRLDEARHD